MKKFLILASIVFVTSVANAKTEYYTSVKLGAGDTTIYVDDNTKLGDYFVKISEENRGVSGYKYDDSGLLLEMSAAVGIDWATNGMYGTPRGKPYGRLYRFHFRLEGEFGYNYYGENGKIKQNYTITDEIDIKFNQIFLMANGYVDFRIDKVVPYVGLGLGYVFGKDEITIRNEYGEAYNSVNDNGLMYALYAGLGYKYSDITTLDLGYKRAYAPTDGGGEYVFQSVRLGARFRI